MMHAPRGPKMTRAYKEELIGIICKQLQPLRQPDIDITKAVKQKQKWLARAIAAVSEAPINIKAINKAAKELRTLLKNTFFGRFKELDEQLQYFEKIKGPDIRHDRPKKLTAEWARTLIKEFSLKRPTNNPKGPLRVISGLIYQYTTEQEKEFDFERACELVLRLAPPPRNF